ncbi:hypothetical protein [Kutzneria sp. CA-103260]|uniref:hypothetical protein n=1 Tax=Kutzneria sp. CA-103260 TaxID=2802641 RepID=UPI001BADBD4D|nr:hypothetical protein [Kutzneria sp. CA-103260]QUQ66255.1 hypothetical protein JJ691_39820 [Kutzneria sp. CA-103260]
MRHNRFGRFAAVVALAGTALLAAGATAEASPADPVQASPSAASGCLVPKQGSITIAGSVAIAVSHLANCGPDSVILSPGQDTYHTLGWKEAAGAYIGSGFTAHWYVKGVSGQGCHVSNGGWVLNLDGGNLVVWADKSGC